MAGCLKNGCWNQEIVNGTVINTPDANDPRFYENIHPYMSKFAWTFVILVVLVTFFSITGDYINVCMRQRVTTHLQTRLFHGNILYRLTLDGRVDNFDQRITSDLQALYVKCHVM